MIGKLLTALCAICIAAAAQASVVKGKIVDEAQKPIDGVTLKVFTLPDSAFVKGALTDDKGAYSISGIKSGRYMLVATMIGLKDATVNFRVIDNSSSLAVPDIVMRDNATLLSEVVVKGEKAAVVMKQDTIEFNAESYKTKQNAVVEDLLKKLPGVEVGSDGSITSGGKTISKILVDGKEFFSDDPKMASKNLPSDIVDKIQVVDRKSDVARLTGVDDGEEETVINLTVKKGMKNGWFGTVMGGYGTDKRYNAGFNINTFSDGNQITFLGSANNVNDMTFTDMGRGRFRSFGGNNGITTSQSIGVNFNLGKAENLRFGGHILYTHSVQDYHVRSTTQNFMPATIRTRESKSVNNGHNVRADFRLEWKIDEHNTIDFRPRFSFNSRRSEQIDTGYLRNDDLTGALINYQENYQDNTGKSFEASGNLVYNHKVASHPGRSFSAQVRYSFSDTKERGYSWSDIIYYLAQDDSEKLYRYLDNHTWSNSIEGRFTWTEPLGDVTKGNFLQIAYRTRYNFNNADKLTYDLPTEGTSFIDNILKSTATLADAVLNESLSNSFRNDFFTQELQLGYKKVHSKYNLDAGLQLSPAMSRSKDLINSARDIPTRWVVNVAPYVRFRYKFTKQRNLSIDYRARQSQPSMTQLQPVADESDPLHIVVGNPDLKPSFNQNLMIRFSSFEMEKQRALMGMLRVSHTLNGIVSRTVTDPTTGVQSTTYANVNNGYSIMAMGMINQPLQKLHWRISGNLFMNYTSSPGYINGLLNRSGNFNLRPMVGITYNNDWLQISARPNYGLQLTTNTLEGQQQRTVHSYGVFADANLYLPCGFEFSTDLNFDKTSGYASGYNQAQWLWNAQVSYSFLKGKRMTLSVKVYDILQQRKSISRSVSATSIVDQSVNTLTRYVMATLTYKFQTFAGNRREMGLGPGQDMPPRPGFGGPRGGRRPF